MTDKQPKALRLADDLQSAVQTYPQMSEDEPGGYCRQEDALMDDAAAELRRLHALNLEWQQKAATWFASPAAAQRLDGYQELAQRLNAAEQQRYELLKALKACLVKGVRWHPCDPVVIQASYAIAKAEGEKK